MFRVKICGITNIEDSLVAVAAGADAIGLNFYGRSPRCVDVATAKAISAGLPREITKVGVFVNMSAEEICEIVREVPLAWIQLHGEEPPKLVAEMPKGVHVIRAHRCDHRGLAPLADYLSRAAEAGRTPDAVLLDGPVQEGFGGAGQMADWRLIARQHGLLAGIPLILAGGLVPGNVAQAIRMVHPTAVDVASGVELRAGKKDPHLVQQFVHRAAIAFSEAAAIEPK